jgi:hypothetical protein
MEKRWGAWKLGWEQSEACISEEAASHANSPGWMLHCVIGHVRIHV